VYNSTFDEKMKKMDPIENLRKLGLKLPNASKPGGSYVSVDF
jgi:hypothetical protein